MATEHYGDRPEKEYRVFRGYLAKLTGVCGGL